MVGDHIALGKVEERIVLQQRVLEVVALDRGDLDVGSDSAAAVNGASAVSQFYFAIGVVFVVLALAVEVIVVERNVGVVTLNQASARRVVLGRGQRQTGVLRQRINRLHQTFAESSFADDQAAIMILNRAGNNLSRRCGSAVHQHDQRIFLAAVAVRGDVTLLGEERP